MKLFIITGTCGAGKTSVRDLLADLLDRDRYACIDTDQVDINWWDYAGTDHEERFSDDCLAEAVRRAGNRDLLFFSCMNPQDYIGRHTIPPEVEATFFVVLCPEDEVIRQRLQARPVERGFTSEEAIQPQVQYNQWFRWNRGKFPLFIDNSRMNVTETAGMIRVFVEKQQ